MFTPLFSPNPAEAESVDLWPHEIKELEQKRLKEIIKKRKAEEAKKSGLDFLHKANETRIKENEQKVKLQEMANKVASQPGYQDFMKMPLMSKLGNSFGNNNQTKTTFQQDTSFTKVGASNKQKDIKKKETQADVMAKMFNLMQENYTYNENRIKQNQKYQKQLTEQKEKFFKEIVHTLTTDEDGKSLSATGKSLKKGKMGRVAKKSKLGGTLKFGIKTAAVLGGLFVAKDALASIDWEKALGGVDFKGLDLEGLQTKLGFGKTDDISGEITDAKDAVNFFIQKGWSPEQSAGIVGNLQAESGKNLNIKAVGDGGKAYGVAQWHPDRQANFKKEFGKDIKDSSLKEQLEFVNLELNTTESKAGNQLRGAKTAGEAATIVDKSYERSSGQQVDKRINYANELLSDNKNASNSTLSPLSSKNITSAYGQRNIFGKEQFHEGVDIKGKMGDAVVASDSGKVVTAGSSGAYGNMVEIDHGNGMKTRYGHLSKMDVSVGDIISKGQKIGAIGDTGRVTGPHLHYEVLKDNKKIDPSSMKALYVNPVADFKLASVNNQPNSGSSQVIINTSTQVKTDTQMVNPVSPYAVAGKYPAALQASLQ